MIKDILSVFGFTCALYLGSLALSFFLKYFVDDGKVLSSEEEWNDILLGAWILTGIIAIGLFIDRIM